MTVNTSEQIDYDRRRLFGVAALSVAAAELGMTSAARAQTKTSSLPAIKPGTNSSFGPLKQIDAGVLNVGYAEAGPANGAPVILLHGWPYDIHAYAAGLPRCSLPRAYRVLIPYLRGYGTTQFRSAATPRNGEQAAFAVDAIALMDALRIQKAVIAGFDWGARTADMLAALWPERCKALVSVSGYLIGREESEKEPLPQRPSCNGGTDIIRHGTRPGRLRQIPPRFSKLIWQLASPKWGFDDATFDRTAAAFDNPDHVDIVITITAGGSGWPKAKRNMMRWSPGFPRRRSPCPPSPWRAMPMARRIPPPAPMPGNSRAHTSTASSPAASAIICRRRRRRPSRRQSSTSREVDQGRLTQPASVCATERTWHGKIAISAY